MSVCGSVEFRHSVSDILFRHSRQSKFFELEHQPRQRHENRSHAHAREDQEMAIPVPDETRNVSGEKDLRRHRRRINATRPELQ